MKFMAQIFFFQLTKSLVELFKIDKILLSGF